MTPLELKWSSISELFYNTYQGGAIKRSLSLLLLFLIFGQTRIHVKKLTS